jgi:PKD repeat protein
MYRSDNVMDESPEFMSLTTYLPGSGNVFDIEAHPFNEDVVYITRGSKVYVSENRGFSWEDITSSLPDINMNSLAYYKNSNNGIYVGSDAGVYYRDASMDDWIMFSDGLPFDASINEIEIYHNPDDPSEDVIRAGTYGRGLWSSPMYQEEPIANFEADQTNIPVGCPINFFDLSTGVPTSWEWTFEGGTPSSSTEKNPENIAYASQGTFNVSLTVSNSQGNNTNTINGYIEVSEGAVPEVYFVASDSITCSGVEIEFSDMSVNCPTDWEWNFTPSTITYVNGTNQNSQDPSVMFDESGVYSVSLTVTNEAGNNTLTKENYISIGGISLPFTDDFESATLNAKSWSVDNPDFNTTWDIATVAGNGGGNAAFMDLFNYLVPPGPRDRLITPVLSFESFTEVYLSFDYAYAKRHNTATDSLIVYISNDCGENWTRLFQGGEDGDGSFATHELTTDYFTPEVADDWCGSGFGPDCITIDISAWAGQSNIQVAFESYSHFGNNLYIDNVSIGTLTDVANYSMKGGGIKVYPNPSNGVFNIILQNQAGAGSLSIYNLQGAEVYKTTTSEQSSVHQINLSELNKGVYFIHYVDEMNTHVKKVVVE